MSDKKHKKQSVNEFKAFVKKNPELISLVRQGDYTWQDLFEEWYLRGDNNELWKDILKTGGNITEEEEKKTLNRENMVGRSAKRANPSSQSSDTKEKVLKKTEKKDQEKESNSDLIATVFQAIKNMDMNQVQQHISSLNQALAAIQGVLSQFQENTDISKGNVPERQDNPFVFRKD
ncbi:hypothetical protein D0469_04210 [Peribacillus saganii]|uniref:Uncharacterized protein n=1 Tax=Peribacillus saganii TaxID=2303992 RepID=A0A372LSJ2_9BACI|nr:spore coat protein YlbD [Peribacillus saganii]RFU71148.1 hypothetical protein D0469_04210 [Peribacillus saganii]